MRNIYVFFRLLFILLFLGMLVSPPLQADTETDTSAAPFEDFPAADFTRGEKAPVGEVSIGVYTHYQRFDNVAPEGESIDGAAEIHDQRWIPVMIVDYQPTAKWKFTSFLHAAVLESDIRVAGSLERETETLGGLSDLILVGLWSPWSKKDYGEHKHHFFDAHNLSFAFGPKFDLSRQSDNAGTQPGGVLLRTGNGAHEGNVGLVYSAYLNDVAWLYYFAQGSFPFTDNNFGMLPGNRFFNKIGASWLPHPILQLFLEVNFSLEGKGRGGDLPQVIPNTGGEILSLTQGLTVDIWRGWGMEVSGSFPLKTWLNGNQPKMGLDLFFGFYKVFN